jgi:pSer/pThr/pTyr-binding forkhead associated (FHA) protein
MAEKIPVLIGVAGLVDGEIFPLATGQGVVGRSRSCPISLRKVANYLRSASATRDNDHDFNTVSRRHVRVTVSDSVATVEDLSTNGTFCNGDQLSGSTKIDLGKGPCSIRLGTREQFELTVLPIEDERLVGRAVVNADAPVEPDVEPTAV